MGSKLDEKGCCYSSPGPEEATDRRGKMLVVDVSKDSRWGINKRLDSSYYTIHGLVCVCVVVIVLVTCIAVSSVTTVSRRGGGGGEVRMTPISLATGSEGASETFTFQCTIKVKMHICQGSKWCALR